MSRTIKFRAWDKGKGVMIYQDSADNQFLIGLDGSVQGYDDDDGGKSGMWEHAYKVDVILLQSTGLVDKQGKMIYEGDIVDVGISNMLSGERYLCYVDYIPANFIFRNLNKSLSTTSPLLSFNNSTMFKIIGNIYENPELLTKE